jgi:Holliday junction DNA helicase RuvB
MALSGVFPDSWDEYVGQETAKHDLRVAIASAKKRGTNLGHLLITSPFAGVGKTALAQLVAREMGAPVLERSGTMTLADVRMMFASAEDGDIVFYDEIHQVVASGTKNAQWFYHYLENGVLVTPWGPEEVPQVTIIGATTDKDLLPEPVLQRFRTIALQPYTVEEGAQIAAGFARKLMVTEGLPGLSDDAALAVARAGSSQPRLMRKLVESLRDLTLADEIMAPGDGNYPIQQALRFAGLTLDGLTEDAVRYMLIMQTEMHGQPTGASMLRERLGLVGRGLAQVEALLTDKGYLMRTKQGRLLTNAGLRRAKLLVAENGE